MKLYAKIENENSKLEGMGGNESLKIEINKGNRRMCEFYITIEDIQNNGGKYETKELMVIDMLNLSDGTTARVYEYEFYQSQKQKGDLKWFCGECGKKKEEYEALLCDNCFKNGKWQDIDIQTGELIDRHE